MMLVLGCGGGSDEPPTPAVTTSVPGTVSADAAPAASPTPARTTAKPTTPPATHRVSPRPRTTTASVRRGVHAGAFCSPEGAYGRTAAGTLMHCEGPGQARWRRA
jgi:hypothetical protein